MRCVDVENAVEHRAAVVGFHVDCRRDAVGRRVEGVRIAEAVRRDTALGAERAKDLMEIMMK